MIAVDFEYNEQGKLLMFQWFDGSEEKYLLNPTKTDILTLIEGKEIVGYNLLNDFKVVGFTVEELQKFTYHDLMLASFIAFYDNWDANNGWSLDKILNRLGLNIENKKEFQKTFAKTPDASLITDDMIQYALSDVRYLLDLYSYFKKIGVIDDKVYRLDMLMFPVVLDMMYRGLPFDVAGAINEKLDLQNSITEIERAIKQTLGNPNLNLNSPTQLKRALNLPSTDKQTLINEVIYNNNIIARELLTLRNKIKRMQFLEKYIELSQRTGRLHGNFSITFAPSGRMTCRDENLQQIPRDLKHLIKSKNYLVKIDFPAIELRLAAILHDETVMLKLFKEGADLHTYTAQYIYNKQEITKEERQIAKSLNFGLLYGMSPNGLKEYLETNLQKPVDLSDCMQFRISWFSLYPGYKYWHSRVYNTFKKQGYYEGYTLYGRKYKTSQVPKALNIQVQGSGAELLKAVAVRSFRRGVRFINLVHDELLMEAISEEQAKEYVKIVSEEVEAVWGKFCETTVGEFIPIPLEPQIKKQWGE